jgi:predicted anti-sigma-YlaC factor YlaD
MTEPEITCHDLVDLVTDYLEGTMERSEQERLELHLSGCRSCRHYLDQMRQTIKTVGQLPVDAVSPAAQEELLSVFRAWKRG